MTEIILRDNFTVELQAHSGNDWSIGRAAWVSTGNQSADEGKLKGLLSFLMKNRHGTPFEHASMTFRVTAPIFIWREWHRHRIGFSYNEESGRYKKLDPVFYVPSKDRFTFSVKPADFKPSSPGFKGFLGRDGTEDNEKLKAIYQACYDLYEQRIADGLDNGLARICLPVSIYSTCYVTCNPRSLMNFLELRVDTEKSTRRSHPLWEMHVVALKVEDIFRKLFPLTYVVWSNNGRVAP